MSSCFSRCLRVPIAMRRFYGQSLWTPQKFLLTNLDFHHGLLGVNDNGNVLQIVNNRDGNRTQNFLYDSLNRIQQAYTTGANWGEDFTIDAWGNLTNRSLHANKTTYEPLNAPALTTNQLVGFGYDAAGNMTSYGTIG